MIPRIRVTVIMKYESPTMAWDSGAWDSGAPKGPKAGKLPVLGQFSFATTGENGT